MELVNLYLQNRVADRCIISLPVEQDRRSGVDRRAIKPDPFKPFYIKQAEKRLDPKIKNSFSQAKEQAQLFLYFFPTVRKLFVAINDFKANEPLKFVADVGRMLNDLPEDLRDSKTALTPSENKNFEYQRPFSFTRGTLISKLKISDRLQRFDKTLFDYFPVQKLLVKFGMTGYKELDGKLKIEGKILAKVLGRAALRTTIMGVGFSAGLEGIHILTSKDKKQEAIKSTIRLVSVISLISLLGAIGAFYGFIVGFIGMWAGYLLGRKISNYINNTVFSPKPSELCPQPDQLFF